MELNKTLQKIKDLLDERNWSLYKLAKNSGIPYSSLNSLFQKNNQPTISSLEKICSGFHITMSEFFSDNTPYREVKYDLNEEDWEIINIFHKLSKRDKRLFLSILEVLKKD